MSNFLFSDKFGEDTNNLFIKLEISNSSTIALTKPICVRFVVDVFYYLSLIKLYKNIN